MSKSSLAIAAGGAVAMALAAAAWLLGWVGWTGAAGTPAGGTRLHKCVQVSGTIYTDADCPAGSRPQALQGGTLTVVPATRPAAAAASSAGGARLPHARDLLQDTQAADLLERRIDAATGR